MVHGLMATDPGLVPNEPDSGLSGWPSRAEHRGVSSNVGPTQAGYLAFPTTESPETQIYFITHRSGAFLVLRLRTVVRGERASRSIMKQMIASWSMVMVHGLMVAGSSNSLV